MPSRRRRGEAEGESINIDRELRIIQLSILRLNSTAEASVAGEFDGQHVARAVIPALEAIVAALEKLKEKTDE